MRKDNLSIKVSVDCKEIKDANGNVIAPKAAREFVFRKGKPVGDGMPVEFCERNCELFKICERVKSPIEVDDPRKDTLQVWCASQDFDSTYYPHNVVQEFPELFGNVIDQDPAFRLSEIKASLCEEFCMDYKPGEECEKCRVPGNHFCPVSWILHNKVDRTEPSSTTTSETENVD